MGRYDKSSAVAILGALLAAWPTVASADDGSIVGWGSQVFGGDLSGDFVTLAGGRYFSLCLKSDGTIVALGENDYGQCNVPEPNNGFIAIALVVLLAGYTQYYRVTDPVSGKQYYTHDWMAARYTMNGALVFNDHASGKQVTLQSSELEKISKAEYGVAVGVSK